MALRNIPRAPIIAFALFLLMAVPSFTEFYTDWLWFGEVGYRGVYLKSITNTELPRPDRVVIDFR